uniref:RNA-dependent RNA polymerase n=1 Tax=Shahe bunya-like virus 1 TaxID=1923410 RepID=A0A1L3KPK3_9VIRU|nr:RNA-dependent RNA polymerase [Shahe bunya-like virus 1]
MKYLNDLTLNEKIIVDLQTEFGPMLEKVNWINENQGPRSLGHFKRVLELAINRIDSGEDVILIEGTNSSMVRVLEDIDLMTRRGEKLVAIDFTRKARQKDFRVAGLDEFKSKRSRLLSMFKENVECEVWVKNVEEFQWVFDLSREPDNFKEEWEKVDEFMDNLMRINCDLLLSKLSPPASNDSHIARLERHKQFFEKRTEELIRAIEENNESSAKIHKDLMLNMTDPNGHYGKDLYTKINNSETKRFPMLGRLNRGLTEDFDPFKMCAYLSNKLNEHFLYWVSKSTSEWLEMTSGELKGALIRRVTRKDGEMTKMVEIKFEGCSYENGLDWMYGRGRISSRREVQTSSLSHTLLERRWKRFEDSLSMKGNGSRYLDDIHSMIPMVMENDKTSEFTKLIMKRSLTEFSNSIIGELIAQHQEICMSVSLSGKKRGLVKNVGGLSDKILTLSVEPIGDRRGVVLNNLSFTAGGLNNVSYRVFGEFIDDGLSTFMRYDSHSSSRWYNMSPSDMDWGVTCLHRVLSFHTMLSESSLTVDKQRKPLSPFPLLCAMMNNSKFSQVSEQTRYLAMNSTGISAGCSELYKKIEWYKPINEIDKLYVLRMIKMANLVQLFKANGKKKLISSMFKTKTSSTYKAEVDVYQTSWTICFPHESQYLQTDQNFFNSMYICKLLSMQRYNKLMSESLVLLKQIKVRKDFLEQRSAVNDFSLRYCDVSEEGILAGVENMWNVGTSHFNENIYTVASACAVTLKELADKKRISSDTTLGSLRESVYKDDTCLMRMNLIDSLNTRGSVLDKGKYGIIQSSKDKKQNGKCYSNVLTNLCEMVNKKSMSVRGTRAELSKEYSDEEYTDTTERDSSSLEKVSSLPRNLFYLVIWNQMMDKPYVAKMVHKDQIGVREISVLNSPARLGCLLVENFSRNVRRIEHSLGDRTNLIEVKDKDEIVTSHYLRIQSSRNKKNRRIVYDNADCTTWGPGMLAYILYMCLCSKLCSENERQIVKSVLMSFSDRVFKVPDEIYSMRNCDSEGSNSVSEAIRAICELSGDLGNMSRQILFNPEGMFQGILGNTSSILAADVQRLSNFLIRKADPRLNVTSFVTSDDYHRSIVYDVSEDEESSVIKTCNLCVNVVVEVGSRCTVKRNLFKSTFSQFVAELNSIFRTSSGIMNPDIKSRISFIDFSNSFDLYQSAVRACSQGIEYLCKEGSVVGSIWVQLLNSHLHIVQHQLRSLLKGLGKNIFNLPLEIGGLIKIDPVKNLHRDYFSLLKDNYFGDKSLEFSVSFLLHSELDRKDQQISLDQSGAKSLVPSISRSGIINLCRREPREKRAMREVLSEMDQKFFSGLMYPGSVNSLQYMLVSCLKREPNEKVYDESSLRYSLCQTPMDKEIFKMNSGFWEGIFDKDKISRKDLIRVAKAFSVHNVRDYGDSFHFDVGVDTLEGYQSKKMCVKKSEFPLDYNNMTKRMTDYSYVHSQLSPSSVSNIPKKSTSHKFKSVLLPASYTISVLSLLKGKFLPEALGGKSTLKVPEYFEAVNSISQKLRKMSVVQHSIHVTKMSDEVNEPLCVLIYKSNFLEGARLMFDSTLKLDMTIIGKNRMTNFFKKFNPQNHRSPSSSPLIDPLNSDYMENSRIDLTSLISEIWSGELKLPPDLLTELAQRLFLSFKNRSSPFWVRAWNLKLPRQNRLFQGSAGTKISYNVKISQDMRSSEIIMSHKDESFVHHVTVFQGDEKEKEDTKRDSYHYMRMSETMAMRIELKIVESWLFMSIDDHLIFPICSAPPEMVFDFFLIRTGAKLISKEDFSRVRNCTLDSDPDISAFYSELRGEYPEAEEDERAGKVEIENDVDFFEVDGFEEFGTFNESFNLSEAPAESEMSLDEDTKSSTFTTRLGMVSISSALVNSLITSDSIRILDYNDLETMKLPQEVIDELEEEVNEVYKVSLPLTVEPDVTIFRGEPKKTPFSELMDYLSSNEYEWSMTAGFLNQVIRKSNLTKHVVN